MNYTRKQQQLADDAIADTDAEISMMVSMGFSADQAAEALNATNGNIDQAIDHLLSGGKKQDSLPFAVKRSAFHASPDNMDTAAPSKNENMISQGAVIPSRRNNDTLRRGTSRERPRLQVATEHLSTPSLGMMVISKETTPSCMHPDNIFEDVESQVRAEEDAHATNQESQSRYPGAVAVQVTNTTSRGEDFTITGGSVLPVTAQIVHTTEDYKLLEEQVRQQGEQLQRVLAGMENAVVAEVISSNEEVQDEEAPTSIPGREEPTPTMTEPSSAATRPRRKWISLAVLTLVVICVGIALGVAIPMTKKSTIPQPASVGPIPTQAAPTSGSQDSLMALISSVSLDGGTALQTPSTPQNDALNWLAGNANLDTYSDTKKIQRYVLATLYYSTNGDGWDNNTGWLSDSDECGWYTDAAVFGEYMCSKGAVIGIDFFDTISGNNLFGTIPDELALLSDSLGECS